MFHTAYKYKLDLTLEQKKKLTVLFNAENFIYKWFYQKKIEVHKKTKRIYFAAEAHKELNSLIKNHSSFFWLKCLPEQSRYYALYNLDKAFVLAYKTHKAYPTFKKYRIKQIPFVQSDMVLNFEEKAIEIPMLFERFSFIYHRSHPNYPKQCTLLKYSNENYYLSFLCETPKAPISYKRIDKSKVLGIDLNLGKQIVTGSNGKKIKFPDYLQKHYDKWQKHIQKLKTKVKNSKNYQKQFLATKNAEFRYKNALKDFYYKTAKRIINTQDIELLCFESLNFHKVAKTNKSLHKALMARNLNLLTSILAYKSISKGLRYCVIDQYDQSSKKCPCGFIYEKLELGQREWSCPECLRSHNRDLNAAKNIAVSGIKKMKI